MGGSRYELELELRPYSYLIVANLGRPLRGDVRLPESELSQRSNPETCGYIR